MRSSLPHRQCPSTAAPAAALGPSHRCRRKGAIASAATEHGLRSAVTRGACARHAVSNVDARGTMPISLQALQPPLTLSSHTAKPIMGQNGDRRCLIHSKTGSRDAGLFVHTSNHNRLTMACSKIRTAAQMQTSPYQINAPSTIPRAFQCFQAYPTAYLYDQMPSSLLACLRQRHRRPPHVASQILREKRRLSLKSHLIAAKTFSPAKGHVADEKSKAAPLVHRIAGQHAIRSARRGTVVQHHTAPCTSASPVSPPQQAPDVSWRYMHSFRSMKASWCWSSWAQPKAGGCPAAKAAPWLTCLQGVGSGHQASSIVASRIHMPSPP